MDKRPIGVFDSGVGGLTLLRELDNLMPYESFIYVGDTGRMPYGTKTRDEIISQSQEIIDFLEKQNCKLIVIACNTVSGLLGDYHLTPNKTPVIGMINYGCVSAALYVTYNFRIGIWATQLTLDSGVYQKFIDSFDPTVEIITQPCTSLIPMIENGAVGSPRTRAYAEDYLLPMLRDDIDTLILGCTHLPFIKTVIQDIVSPAITLIDPARRTAVLCMKKLHDTGMLVSNHSESGTKQFFVTGDPAAFRDTTQLLVGPMVDFVEKINLSSKI
ncbi:MAG: glutamate racemase [bacterium]